MSYRASILKNLLCLNHLENLSIFEFSLNTYRKRTTMNNRIDMTMPLQQGATAGQLLAALSDLLVQPAAGFCLFRSRRRCLLKIK